MIWLDITDPKYVLFFKDFIPLLKGLDDVLITTRKSDDYDECANLLGLFDIQAVCIGEYGGAEKLDKLQARLMRQQKFLELFKKIGTPKIFITGVSVEGCHTAYGLNIPIIQFSDTPIIGHRVDSKLLSIVARLSLPLSTLIFHPFIVPSKCYKLLGLNQNQIFSYKFIDVALWLKDLKPAKDFRDILNIPKNIPTILVREEEYKAHYVKSRLNTIYEGIKKLSSLNVNIVIMPRYGNKELKQEFKKYQNIYIAKQKFKPQEFYPYIDLLIGGGGTMNLESCYLGIPTISTRSLFLFHDIYLLKNNLMQHAKNSDEIFMLAKNILTNNTKNKQKARSLFEPSGDANFKSILKIIKKKFYS